MTEPPPELAAAQASWDAYFWPGTQVLRNNLGLRDPRQLHDAEMTFSLIRSDLLMMRPDSVDLHRPTSQVLQDIHGRLLGDVYPWAGQNRTVSIVKAGEFASVAHMDSVADLPTQMIAHTLWASLSRADVADQLAHVYQAINHAHLFREGNGRAGKMLITLVAEKAGLDTNYDAVPAAVWNYASQTSRPLNGYWPVPADLTAVFQSAILVERRPALAPDITQALAAHQAAFTASPAPRYHVNTVTGATRAIRSAGRGTGPGYGR